MISKQQDIVLIIAMTTVLAIAPLTMAGIVSGQSGDQQVEDKYPETCRPFSEVPIADLGTISGTQDSLDRDKFRVRLEEGQRYTITTRVADGHGGTTFDFSGLSGNDESRFIILNHSGSTADSEVTEFGPRIEVYPHADGSDAFLSMRVDETMLYCFSVIGGDVDTNRLFEWELTITNVDEDESVSELEGQSQGDSEDEETVQQLQRTIEQKEQRISELESEVEELKDQTEELEAQLESAQESQEVSLEITVRPGEGQNNFVAGGVALVEVEAGSASLSQLQIEYRSGTYEVDQDGQIRIPLADTGQHEMKFVYGDTTESVTLNVQHQDGQTNQTGGSAPGFGFGIAIATILCLGLLFRQMS
ncbi:hypothetical protein [Haloplanus aerogenes]|uniref:Uncharacterized protein n=1 Tax=Haloplanus aerogenes TaxID=660522 RepID=A0A3M0CMW8_9EURY|nr:hypothetical protein [Haloplanus aerogenes]AZH26014.1 hypothetical protein DU502_11865 [Haloplanus aerogenes]RMB08256.1 hypothetical protein ATH50_3672 [Haloplanus aerogenes]